MTFKKIDVINRILVFCDEVKIYRKELMVRKHFICESEEYTDELWEIFKEIWLSKPLL